MGVKIVQAANAAEALPLYWEDTLVAVPYSNGESVTMAGLSNLYDSIAGFPEYGGECLVQNGVVMRPNLDATQATLSITSTGGTKIITSREIDRFRLTLSLPGGLYGVDTSTGYVARSVSVGVYFRVNNPEAPDAAWTVGIARWVFSGKQRAEIIKTKTFDVPTRAKYDILVVRNTADHTGFMNIIDDVFLKEVTEIVDKKVAYNHTALLGIKIRATDQLSGAAPTVTALVKGTKVAVPSNFANVDRYDVNGNYNGTAVMAAYTAGWTDGALTWDEATLTGTKYWTDNPVWCLYDLLTNTRYGLAEYYKIADKKRGLILANFYIMAKYCDEPITYTDNSGASPVTKTRPRFALNMVIDQAKSASEWIAQICSVMRAAIFYTEGMLWLEVDRPKPISQIFNMSNITSYTQSGTSYKQIPNTYEIQYINPLANYEIDSFRLESKELQTNPNIEERKKALTLVGVTNFDQAKALGKYALFAGQHRTKVVSFKTGTDGLRCTVADVIGIQHDVPAYGWGGVVEGYDADTRTITLSAPFKPKATHVDSEGGTVSNRYYIQVSHSADAPVEMELTGVWNEVERTTATILSETPAIVPAAGDKYIIGEATNKVALFKVTSVKRDSEELCEILAIEYNESIYTASDDTSDQGTFTEINYSLLQAPIRDSVQGVTANTKIYQDSAGAYKIGVEVFYSPPVGNSFWRGAVLNYGLVDSNTYLQTAQDISGYFFIPEITVEGNYQFVVTSVYSQGKQTIEDALAAFDRHPWATLSITPYVPNNYFVTGVTGLSVFGMGNDPTFNSKDCKLVWRKPQMLDAGVESGAGETTSGAGTAASTSWFSHYIIDILNVDGSVRRTAKIYDEQYVYTHEMNHQDGLTRNFSVRITAYDRVGRSSKSTTLAVSNPAPAVIS